MPDEKRILILGGGVGGVVTAKELRKRLPRDYKVTLIDRAAQHLFSPSLLWLVIGERMTEQISRPLTRLERKGIEVIPGEILSIDPLERKVRVGDGELTADYVVLSLGAELFPEGVSGLVDAGFSFYTPEGAEGLRDALGQLQSGRLAILTATPAYKCPAAPYEAAMLIEYYTRKRGIRQGVQIDLYAAESAPMGVAGQHVSAAVRNMLEEKGIGYHPEHQIGEVDAATLRFQNGAQADFDLLAYVPPHEAPRVVRQAGLTDASGWIPVDRHTLETKFPRVYAIGDVTTIPLKVGKPLPMAGVFAHRQAEVVAKNIAREITGKGEAARFTGDGECFIETGDGRAGFGKGDFYAEPAPTVKLHGPGRQWHLGKKAFERDWLRRWF